VPTTDELWCHAVIDGEYCGIRLKPSRRGGRPPKYCPPHRGYRPHARTEAPRLRLVLPEGTPEPTGKVAERVNAELERVADALKVERGDAVLTVLGGTRQRLAELDAAGAEVNPALRALIVRLANAFESVIWIDPTKLATLSREFRSALVDLEPERGEKRNADPFGLAEIFRTEAS